MKLTAIHVVGYNYPMLKPHLLDRRRGVIVTVETESGITGRGEVAPLPGFSNETLESAVDELRILTGELVGKVVGPDLANMDGSLAAFIGEASPSVRFGLEQALLEIVSWEQAKSLPELLGTDSLEIYLNSLLIADESEAVITAARLHKQGIRAIKLKVGQRHWKDDAALVTTLDKIIGESTSLRIDANQNWDLDTALKFSESCAHCDIEYLEEPTGVIDDLKVWAEKSAIPLALDETIQRDPSIDLDQFPGLAAVVLKPTLIGGIERTIQIARKARQKGIKAVLSAAFEGPVGLTALAQLAAAMPDPTIPVGLDTYSWFGNDVLPVHNGTLKLSDLVTRPKVLI